MKSPWHRNTSGASQALRFNGLRATAAADGHVPGLAMHARWNPARTAQAARPVHTALPAQPASHPHSHSHAERRGARRSAWKPRLAGLLAAGALALGVLAAGSDTCVASESSGMGNYSQSTLAPITASRAEMVASARGGACRHRHKTGRFAQPKTVL
ncbi:hypothetical protein VLK31_25835 [Variovorax sp. H27-G14]|uniref:hypothetical protein n=1 Tax=Variovorax sp. H27-G14 TaxID=3111914 RepID=UPI0038FCC4A3